MCLDKNYKVEMKPQSHEIDSADLSGRSIDVDQSQNNLAQIDTVIHATETFNSRFV